MLLTTVTAQTLAADDAANSPNAPRDVGIDQRLNVQAPLEVTFRDENGRTVTLDDFFDERPVILTLVYYRCPMLCGLELNGLVRTLKTMEWSAGREFDVLTVSIDPDEGPALAAQKKRVSLKQYGRRSAENGWHFLTGDESAIRQLADAVGFRYVETPENNQFAHAAGLIVLTPDGRTSRYFYGVEYSPRDLRLALVEAADNKIGMLTDQVLLYCYLYDPATGKYTLSILRLLRVAGLGTVAAMAAGIYVMLRRERRWQSACIERTGGTELTNPIE
jgi:protein SCO1/2